MKQTCQRIGRHSKSLHSSHNALIQIQRRTIIAKEIEFGMKAQKLLLCGVDTMADTVQITLGPKGRHVAIQQRSWEAPRVSKDGVTVAKEIELPNAFHDVGASLVYHIANNTNDNAGDGTTTATILARAFLTEGIKAVASGMNPMDIKRGMDRAVAYLVKWVLPLFAEELMDKELITKIATISANGESDIGLLVGEAMEKIGLDGVVQIMEGSTVSDELHVVEGLRFDRGFISPHFVTNIIKQIVEFNNPLLLFYDKPITDAFDLYSIVEQCHSAGRPLVIMADNVDGEALQFLIKNRSRANVKVCAIRTPGGGDHKKHWLKDLSIVTGGTLITDELGMKLCDIKLTDLGQCERITISAEETVLMDGRGDPTDIYNQIEYVKQLRHKSDDWDRNAIDERLARLQGGIAVIKVGGTSELHIAEKKDRIIDALHAVRAAIDDGIVAGGGIALLYASLFLDDFFSAVTPLENSDQKMGAAIVSKVLSTPARTIVDNAADNGALVVATLLDRTHSQLIDNDLYAFVHDIIGNRMELEYGIAYEKLLEISAAANASKHHDLLLSGDKHVFTNTAIDLSYRYTALTQPKYSQSPKVELEDFDHSAYFESNISLNGHSERNDLAAMHSKYLSDESISDEWEAKRDRFQRVLQYGFDSQYCEYCDMIDSGVVDPLKVAKSALLDAASVAGLMITTDVVVIESRKPDPGVPQPYRGELIDPKSHREAMPGLSMEESEEEYKRLDYKYDPHYSLW